MASRKLYMLTQIAAHRARSVADRQAKDGLGLTAAQLAVLMYVRGQPGCTQREIARFLTVRESAVTGSVTKLVHAELVRRERSDGRSYALFPTDAGSQAVARAIPVVASLEATLTDGFSEADLDVIERFLRQIIASFNKESS